MPRLQRMHGRFPGSSVVAIALVAAMTVLCGVAPSWAAAAMTSQTDLADLPLTFPVQSAEIAAYFDQIARPEDVATVPSRLVHLLPRLTAGQKMVLFTAWADAEREMEALVNQIDMIGYNPEHWEHTPANEQENLPATVQQAAEFAHTHGVAFMLAPDRRFAQEHLSQVALHVDVIVLQGQRLQEDPQAFASWVREMSSIARTSNPEVQVYAQVRATRGTASQMFAAIQSVCNDIDGIAVWSMPTSLDVLKEFVILVRERPPVVQAIPTSTSTPVPATLLPGEIGVATSTPDETIAEQEAQTGGWPKQIALIAGGAVIGLLLGVGFGRRRYSQ